MITLDCRGRIRDWNQAAERMFGHSATDTAGQELFRLIAPGGEGKNAAMALRGGMVTTLTLVARRKTGERFPVEMSAFGSRRGGDGSFLVVIRELGAQGELARKHQEMEEAFFRQHQCDERLIWQLMHHDPLTGLPNRLLMHDRISVAMAAAEERDRYVGVLMVGIDHFKHINDTLGHGIGDFLLTTVAARFAEHVGLSDNVARLGGDEFAILLPELQDGVEAERMAKKLLAAMAEPIAVVSHELVLTASIGIALFPSDGADPDALLKNAGAAMYLAKREGDNGWQLYAAEFDVFARERLALEEDLRRALERHEFEVHYQPQVDLRRGVIAGAEALVRWRRPGHGLVSPARFIPLAEETGMIVPIGEWVLQTACAQLKAWQEAGAADLRMAVNLSARQFRQSDLLERVGAILGRTGIRPESLELEITESSLMHNLQKGSAVLRELSERGIRLAIDDFGTGYSSLNYLKRFPIDTLKIDQSFVRQIPQDANDAAIVQAVIQLAHGLQLEVVAEGVETEEQLDFMREHTSDMVQGYFFSPPVAAADFEALLAIESLPRRAF